MGLTEHMPRTELADLYPDELEPDAAASLAALMPRHEAYLAEATRLQAKYASQIDLLIGFEGEWLRPAYGPLIRSLAAASPCVDYFIGSVHHAGSGIPIDLDHAHYRRARDACNRGRDRDRDRNANANENENEDEDEDEEPMWASYYDEQLDMLRALRPRVVGHFDLIRLMSADPGRDVRAWAGGRVWDKVVRNLRFVVEYGGWLELNTAALRKGLAEPYPSRQISEEYVRLGGKFTFSDDSHGIAQVATVYHRGLDFLESLGVDEVMTLERSRPSPDRVPLKGGGGGGAKATLTDKSVPITEFRASLKI